MSFKNNDPATFITMLVLLFTWMAGIVLATGGWLTVLAICLPFYAWYLFVEKIMSMIGMI